jgi:beta-aspartyl-peptidase (threonine type)
VRRTTAPFALVALVAVAALVVIAACDAPRNTGNAAVDAPRPRAEWAVVVHGGAGVIPGNEYEAVEQQYLDSLTAAVELGKSILESGGTSLDAVERVITLLEDDPLFNAGKGAVFNQEGRHELDASIMSGRDMSCGAVAGVTTVKNPIALAREVMEASKHVLFAGDGAERFADTVGAERVSPDYYWTERRREQWRRRQENPDEPDFLPRGTAGVAALDRDGNLAAGTSTGGLTGKAFGRIGDSPIVGAGTYADNRTCAVSGTGKGEEFIRYAVAHRISALMEYRDLTLERAAAEVVHDVLQPGDGGIIAVDRDGNIAMVFNTHGMFRGAADSGGRFEVAIWE